MGGGKHSTNWREKRNSFDDNDYRENITFPEAKTSNDEEFDDDYYDDEEEFNYKKLLIIIGAIALLIIAGVLIYKLVINKPEKEPEPTTVDTPKMMASVEGYKVLGKIVIKDLNIEQYILDSTEAKALQNGVGKIDNGASINNYGNFCLAGHNQENIFKKINELEIGDEFILIDKNAKETTYTITNKYEVEPDNLECLLQDEEKIEVTLVTCQAGSTKRLIVKAEEKNSLQKNTGNTTNTVSTEEDI